MAPSKDDGAYRHSDCTHQRIDEKYLPLVRTKIIGFGRNDHICNHIDQQNPERKRIEQALGKTEVPQVQINAPNPSCKSSCEGDGEGLPERPKKCLVQLLIFLASDQGAKRSRLCAYPGNSDGLDRVCQTERHPHFPRLYGTTKCKENGIEDPKQEVATEPAHGHSPLEWPDFFIPADFMRSRLIAQ